MSGKLKDLVDLLVGEIDQFACGSDERRVELEPTVQIKRRVHAGPYGSGLHA
jgi:hypothetical protein